ncbi:MAG: TerB family tellurite resistance protein [Hyphomicrobiales bacterium]|nr:TerB family tellurite resistance protein [Hyphomicrobiales bacterium]
MTALSGFGVLLSRLLQQDRSPEQADQTAIDALAVLLSVASADGLLQPDEQVLLRTTSGHDGSAAGHFAALVNLARDTPIDDAAGRLRRSWPLPDRATLMARATAIAAADGGIGEIEQATLERLARLLDMDPSVARPGAGDS